MSFTTEPTDIPRKKAPIDGWVIIGLYVMILDGLWGAFAVFGFGFDGPLEITLAVSFLAGLPAYALDMWIGRRVIVFLPALYLFRWLALSDFGSAPFDFSQSWRGSSLLIVASVLLQWRKVRRR
jgi:hypothetical protein